MNRAHGAFALLCNLSLALLSGSAAAAERALVLASGADTTVASAVAQTKAELAAAGFEVVESLPDGAPQDASLEAQASSAAAVATVRVSRQRGVLVADVWVLNRLDATTGEYRLGVAGASREDARVLALRVLDALYASSPELRRLRPAPAMTPSLEALPEERDVSPQRSERAPGSRFRRVRLGAGAIALGGFTELPMAFGPVVFAGVRLASLWGVEAVVGPTFTSVKAETGRAAVDQELFWLRARLDPGAEPGRLAPFGFAALGAYRLGARGRATAPYVADNASGMSFAVGFGGGGRWQPTASVAVLLDATAFFTAPRSVLRFADSEPVRVQQPTFLLSITTEVGL